VRAGSEPTVAVVGGGITGLAAAHRLVCPEGGQSPAGDRPRVVVLEGSGRLGGKILTEDVGGVALEAGPDAFVSGSGHALALCEKLGLADRLISPATGKAYICVSGALHPLPPGLVLGVPTSLGALRALVRGGLLSPRGAARAALDLVLPASQVGDGDTDTVAKLIGARLGDQLLTRVVGPLVGGINAGDASRLSAAAAAPQLLAGARRHRSLMRGLRGAISGGGAPRQGFYSLDTGLGALADRLAEVIGQAGGVVQVRARVVSLSRHGPRWLLELDGGRRLAADAVVLAVPAFGAAELLEPHAPALAGLLREIPYASVSLVSLVYPENAVAHPLDGAGFLAPPLPRRGSGPAPLLTACTFTTTKWPRTKRPGTVVLRASTGRFGDDRALEMDDDDLVGAVHAELSPVLGLASPPVIARVSPWPRAFPQYLPGHLALVSRIEEAARQLHGLALAGAAYHGLGIPACIAQGQAAAASVAAGLPAVVPS
jgi:oxygen-dependent protoporphyrinogen oxidase